MNMDQSMCKDKDEDEDTYEDSDTASFSASLLLKDTFSLAPPPLISGPPMPARTDPQLTHLQMYITLLVASLTSISEHARPNSVAMSEVGICIAVCSFPWYGAPLLEDNCCTHCKGRVRRGADKQDTADTYGLRKGHRQVGTVT